MRFLILLFLCSFLTMLPKNVFADENIMVDPSRNTQITDKSIDILNTDQQDDETNEIHQFIQEGKTQIKQNQTFNLEKKENSTDSLKDIHNINGLWKKILHQNIILSTSTPHIRSFTTIDPSSGEIIIILINRSKTTEKISIDLRSIQTTNIDKFFVLGTKLTNSFNVEPANDLVTSTQNNHTIVNTQLEAQSITFIVIQTQPTLTPTVTTTPPNTTIAPTNSTIVPSNAPSTTPATCSQKSKGDANCDDHIDLQDFEIWRREFKKETSDILADFDGDNKITIADFQIWRNSFNR